MKLNCMVISLCCLILWSGTVDASQHKNPNVVIARLEAQNAEHKRQFKAVAKKTSGLMEELKQLRSELVQRDHDNTQVNTLMMEQTQEIIDLEREHDRNLKESTSKFKDIRAQDLAVIENLSTRNHELFKVFWNEKVKADAFAQMLNDEYDFERELFEHEVLVPLRKENNDLRRSLQDLEMKNAQLVEKLDGRGTEIARLREIMEIQMRKDTAMI